MSADVVPLGSPREPPEQIRAAALTILERCALRNKIKLQAGGSVTIDFFAFKGVGVTIWHYIAEGFATDWTNHLQIKNGDDPVADFRWNEGGAPLACFLCEPGPWIDDLISSARADEGDDR